MLTNAHGSYKMNSPYSRIVGYNFNSLSLLLHCETSVPNINGLFITPDASSHHHLCQGGEWPPIDFPSGITTDKFKFGQASWYTGFNEYPKAIGVIRYPNDQAFILNDKPFTLDFWGYIDWRWVDHPDPADPAHPGFWTQPFLLMKLYYDMGYITQGHNLGDISFGTWWFYRSSEVPDSNLIPDPSPSAPWPWFHLQTRAQVGGWPDYTDAKYLYESGDVDSIANQWVHYAMTRDGDNVARFFVNGVKQWEQYVPINLAKAYHTLGMGIVSGISSYIDEVRVVKGAAKWTTNFTPPEKPYLPPDVAA